MGNSSFNNGPEDQITKGSKMGKKHYSFNETHDKTKPALFWFQESQEGIILFLVFYTQACRWSKCLGCNLPSQMSRFHVNFKYIMSQVDYIFNNPEIQLKRQLIKKVILSNNGSVLDELTFSSTALMYLIAKLNLHLPNLAVLSMETRPEFVDMEELELIHRALQEGDTPTDLEIIIGFEAFDDSIRNKFFNKGLSLETFEDLVKKLAKYNYRLKCYFMLKPVPGISDKQACKDIHRGIDYLNNIQKKYNIIINMHLNPTYVAKGTVIEDEFNKGNYTPPKLYHLAQAAKYAKDKDISIFLGLSDEGLSVDGGSFFKRGEEGIINKLEKFNKTANFDILETICKDYSF